MRELIENLDKIHSTVLGTERIKKNLKLEINDVVDWCKQKTVSADEIIQRGKNWYVYNGNAVITINTRSCTIITAHINHKGENNYGKSPDLSVLR